MARPESTPPEPLFLGRGLTAAIMHGYAVSVGCPDLYFQDRRDTLRDALHQIRRCADRQAHPLRR